MARTSLDRTGAMTLERYRHGGVLFAGNAAHAMPICGVRGLNSGLDDADNLAWKLAYVARDLAGAGLLDSYSTERLQAFHVNAASAMRSTEFMSPPSRGFALMREVCLSLAGDHPAIATLVNPRQTLAIAYDESPLNSAGDRFGRGPQTGAPVLEVRPAPGLPHLTLTVFAGTARDFTLLYFDDEGVASDLLANELERSGHPVRLLRVAVSPPEKDDNVVADFVLDPQRRIRDGCGAQSGSAYLVRPDGHAAGRLLTCPATTVLQALRHACQRTNQPGVQA